jgi:hypothetical protein
MFAKILKGGVGSGRHKVTFHPVQEDKYKIDVHVNDEKVGYIKTSMKRGMGHNLRMPGVASGGVNVRTLSDAKNVARAVANKDKTMIPAGVPMYSFVENHFKP